MTDLFGQPDFVPQKPKINQRAFKKNCCIRCGSTPRIHRNNAGLFYVKCHGTKGKGGCPYRGYEVKTGLFKTPQEAVDCWNKHNKKEGQ